MTGWLRTFLGGGPTLSPTEVVFSLVLGAAALLLGLTAALSIGAVSFRRRAARRAAAASRRDATWKLHLQDVLYGGSPEQALWSHVDPRDELAFLHFLLEYARRLHGDERSKVTDLAEPYLHRLQPYLGRRSATRRARAVQVLGELGLSTHAGTVIDALDDASPLVSMAAATTLAGAKTSEFAIEVLRRLNRFSNWRRDFLAAMIASMGDSAVPALRDILANPEEVPRVRSVAADALATLSDPDAADLAAEAFVSTDDVELQAAALRVLASVGRSAHLSVVRTALAEAPELPVRLAAIRALGRFGLESDLAPLAEAARNDPSPWVAIAAARAMKDSGGAAALEELAGSDHPRAALGLQVISEAKSW